MLAHRLRRWTNIEPALGSFNLSAPPKSTLTLKLYTGYIQRLEYITLHIFAKNCIDVMYFIVIEHYIKPLMIFVI